MTSEDPGRREVIDALIQGYTPHGVDAFVGLLGIRGLSWIIREVLDRHYMEEVFQWETVQFGVVWAGEHGGANIDPGMKWIALLRLALKEVPDA